MAADNNTTSCVREMPLLNSLGINGDASATQHCLPRRRNLVRNALREVEQFFPPAVYVPRDHPVSSHTNLNIPCILPVALSLRRFLVHPMVAASGAKSAASGAASAASAASVAAVLGIVAAAADTLLAAGAVLRPRRRRRATHGRVATPWHPVVAA